MKYKAYNAKRDANDKKYGWFVCQICSSDKYGKITGGRGKYCSTKCSGIARSKIFVGEKNPNFKGNNRKCLVCDTEFRNPPSYNKKFCSSKCYNLYRTNNVKPKIIKPKKRLIPRRPCPACGKHMIAAHLKHCSVDCRVAAMIEDTPQCQRQGCEEKVNSYERRKRKFCSYECFVLSGGPVRAGHAAAEVIMKKYGAKKDANHKPIMQIIGQNCAVHDMSNAGFGVPDGLAYIRGGWRLFDIKNPKTSYGRKGLNANQKEWASDWRGGPVFLIYNVDEARDFSKGKFSEIKVYDPSVGKNVAYKDYKHANNISIEDFIEAQI